MERNSREMGEKQQKSVGDNNDGVRCIEERGAQTRGELKTDREKSVRDGFRIVAPFFFFSSRGRISWIRIEDFDFSNHLLPISVSANIYKHIKTFHLIVY